MDNRLTDCFIERLFNLKESGIPDRVILQAKKCVLDYLGVTLAGAKMLEAQGGRYLDSLKATKGTSTVIAFERKADIYSSILINGLSAHATELDDGHRFGMLHLGSPIITALFSTAELENSSGAELLHGIIVGYEAAIRLACSVQPSHKEKGYHTTGTCGTIGASLGIATALGYTREQTKSALSAAVTSAAGVLGIQDDGSELKPYNAGRAALDGFVSAFVARVGFQGPDDILGGKRGFLSIMSDRNTPSLLVKSVDNSFGIEGVYMKPYASCRHSHPGIEAAIRLVANYSIRLDSIREINIRTYKAAVDGHDHVRIQGINSAKMSIPYSVAVALKTGKAGISEFSYDHITDQDIISLMAKVNVRIDAELTLLAPKKRAAIVEILTFDNKFYSEQIDYPKGEPENPMSLKDVEEKFVALAMYSGKTSKEAELVVQKVWNLEEDLFDLFNVL